MDAFRLGELASLNNIYS